jgi:VCBS repeat-containing protein
MTTITASVSTTLPTGVDDLTLTGSADINGTGNSLNNVITGNTGANILNGAAGADTLIGGAGDDTYIVDNAGDVVVENAGEGTDTVQSSVSYTLSANVENLTLTGSANIGGTGNGLDNVITGNAGSNALSGMDGNDTLVGNAGNDLLDGGTGADNMQGGTGDDTYVVDNAGDIVTEAAGSGTDTVNASISYTLTDNVENLTLTGSANLDGSGNALNNTIIGNSGSNQLFGDAGNDTLNGGQGADTMAGGVGDDTYIVDNAGDVVIEAADAGTDLVQSSVSYTLSDNVENLTLTGTAAIDGTGNALNNVITGNSGANTLSGGAGNDILDGGAGADLLQGGTGDDTFIVDNIGDRVVESAGEGIDTVQASVSYTLADNVENLTLTGLGNINGTGNALDNVIIGNGGTNVLSGLDGNDTLVGNAGNDTLDGGTGADNLQGGAGNDLYVVDNTGDVVVEALNAGLDTVQSSIDYTLGANVENLTLSGTDNLSGTGNALNNLITGNSGDNTVDAAAGDDTVNAGAGNDVVHGGDGNDALNGEAGNDQLFGDAGNDTLDGGAGADHLAGGLGNDTYVVDDAGDLVVEAAGEGTDLVYSSITYALTDNVENLTLTGTANIGGTGNDLDNVINGNAGANALEGLAGNDTLNGNGGDDQLSGGDGNDLLNGGAGADTMHGGTGDDTYIVDNAGDLVVENPGEGTDTVQSSITYTLTENVENLTLTGTGWINGTGNALDNVITGNSGNNALYGLDGNDTLVDNAGNDILDGGAGADNMQGGGGNDTYVVDNAGDVVIEGLNAGIDTVQSSIDYTLTANVENLTLTGTDNLNGTGNALNNLITGNSGDNTVDAAAGDDTVNAGAGNDVVHGGDGNDALNGEAGNDQLFGDAGNDTLDGGAGADHMEGGLGNDTYLVDDAGDVVVEAANAGTDLVYSSITYTLTDNVENLNLSGSANIDGTGNELDNVINGNAGANVLEGLAGNDTLNGNAGDDQLSGGAGNDLLNGGTGADTMLGGTGDDTYVVDSTGDLVVENAGEGTDTVQSSITYTLTDNVENLVLTGLANINGSGNALDNVLTGNGGNNALYGLDGNDTLIGNAGNDMLDGGAGADNLQGGLGNDTYVVDNAGDVVVEAVNAGVDTVQSSISYTLTANVENLTLTGSDDLNGTGNALNNAITGNSGANVIDGGAGIDTMSGGAGDDTYIVDNSADVIVEAANAGTDSAYASATYTLSANVENLFLTGTAAINGTGNAQDNTITGNAANNVLSGMAGNDVLIGGGGNDQLDGGTGADSMQGGTGDDTYIVDDAGDNVIENAGEGTDTVLSSISYKLSANVENLTLTGSAHIDGTGNALDNVITGNGGNNVLDGQDGNDTLVGGAGNDTLIGGAGADNLQGGAGDDTYVVDDADTVVEAAGAGIDTVQSATSHALEANVENLVLTGSANVNGTGNALNNDMRGNDGANVLDGGAGADTLSGGAGDDTYIVDNTADVVVEAAGGGVDTVQASASFTLGANVENLVLTGTASINGTGNAGDNVLTGNGGANTLDGGAGADILNAGAGNDTLIGGTGDDVLSGGAGDDSYRFRPGDGADRIIDDQGSDTLYLGGVARASLVAKQVGNDVLLSISGSSDSVLLANWASQAEGVSRIVFDDGSVIDRAGLAALLKPAVTSTPTAVDDQFSVNEDGGPANLTLAQLLANDTDTDAAAVLKVTAVGESALGARVSLGADAVQYDIGSAFQELAQGQVLKDTFTYTITDAAGKTSTATVNVDIVGVNDAPVAQADSAAVTAGVASTASGNVLANDTDIDKGTVLQVAEAGTIAGVYGSLAIAADGSYVYTLNNGAQNVKALAAGTVVTEHFQYLATDGIERVAASLDIAITGSNDAPVALADAAQVAEDGQLTASGNVLANDSDVDAGTVLKVGAPGTYAGAYGTLVLAQDGSYTYSLNNAAAAVQALAQGQSAVDHFNYAATDGIATVGASLDITVKGANDAPVAAADAAQVAEDGQLAASGNVLANDSDVDAGTVLKVAAPGTYTGAYGTLVLAQDGSYTYSLNNATAAVQALAQGQVVVDHFSYAATDGIANVASSLDFSIAGANDAPVAAGDAAQVAEDGQLTASGNVLANDSDVDAGSLLKVAAPGTYAGTYGTLTLAQDGSYTYSLNNGAAAVQSLAQGQVVVDHFSYAATDGIANVASSLDISIAGANDAPVAVGDAAQVAEDGQLAASGNVLANDRDVDTGTVLKVGAPGTYAGTYGTLVLAQDGGYTYSLNNAAAAVQSLAQGQVMVDHFSYAATDGIANIASSLDISIAGTNDAPVAVGDAAQVAEDGQLTASGNVLANDSDVDAGSSLKVAAPGTYAGIYGTLTLAQDGSYTYSLNNGAAAVQSLAQGQVVVDHFTYAATDGIARTASSLDVSVTGANDKPVLNADSAAISASQASVSGNVLGNDSDIDAGTTLKATAATLAGSYGSLVLAQDGSYVYTLNGSADAVVSLGRGATAVEHFTYSATDGIAAGSSTLDVTLTGANDAPILVKALADMDINFNKTFSFKLPANSFADPDKGDSLTYAATLGNGAALPSWLKFDAATSTFSGTAPKQEGTIEVRVTATDKVAATGSTVGSLSVSDVFVLTVGHGNAGVGNGQDAAPPGQDTNFNDGPGTAPGSPGAKGGVGGPGFAIDGLSSQMAALAEQFGFSLASAASHQDPWSEEPAFGHGNAPVALLVGVGYQYDGFASLLMS